MENTKPERTNREETTRARRTLLVETAITCFVEQGIARTGMRDIASQAGVSVGNLYNHFPGRDDLIAEIAQIETAGLAEVVAQVATCSDARQAVDVFVKSYFAYCADPVSAVLTVEITSEALRNPAIEGLFSGNRAMLVDTLAKAIADCGQEKTQANESAGLVLDTIEGFALRVGLTGKKPKKRETEALISFVRSALTPQGD
ncbi:HTH-type transcriptional regulator BetI [Roseobacter fucihabitans]|uniref:HTH-type transcriptional regulator BetI n=1 Tax=Roseobacter fucihabitans TaxID=1537242 RepID=A0ABZ2BW00_9RHOB|nr:TetR/AcrR family transcriptional regulator [Roseobacter litoralis]MBC6966725.1 HTH-type transcriptional repressor KstR2 [Roseobacter litoralis]